MAIKINRESRIWCYFLAIVNIAVILCFTSSLLLNLTFGNRSYLLKFFTEQSVTQALEKDFENNLESFENNSPIPANVYREAMGNGFIVSVQPSVLKAMEGSYTLNFGSITDLDRRYYEAAKQYNDDNGLNLSDKQIRTSVKNAIDAFNLTCAVTNNGELSPFVNFFEHKTAYLLFFSFGAFIAVIFIEYLLNQRRHKTLSYIAMSLNASGLTMIFTALCGKVLKLHLKVDGVTNITEYNSAVMKACENVTDLFAVAGAVLLAIGIILFTIYFKYYKTKVFVAQNEQQINENLI